MLHSRTNQEMARVLLDKASRLKNKSLKNLPEAFVSKKYPGIASLKIHDGMEDAGADSNTPIKKQMTEQMNEQASTLGQCPPEANFEQLWQETVHALASAWKLIMRVCNAHCASILLVCRWWSRLFY